MQNSNIELMKRVVYDMADSQLIQGTSKDCIDSVLELIILKNFVVISDDYFAKQRDIIREALQELYNVELNAETLRDDSIHMETKSEDWQDSITVVKDTSQKIIAKLAELINDAYTENKHVSLSISYTHELIQARVRSYNGEAYAIDLLDACGNQYTINNQVIVTNIIRGRKFTFETTYGFISYNYKTLKEYGDLLLSLLRGQSHFLQNKLQFMAYSDLLNLQTELSRDTVDIYNLSEINEWLYADNLNTTGTSGLVIYLDITANDDDEIHETYCLLLNRNISSLEVIVNSAELTLDKYTDKLLQKLYVHTEEGYEGILLLPYVQGDDIIAPDTYLALPFDIIEGKLTWNNWRIN